MAERVGTGLAGPGRPKGMQNQLTATVKDTVLKVFQDLQTDPKLAKYNLKQFAMDYPRDFYQIAAKLIPTEVNTHVDGEITFAEIRNYPTKEQADAKVIHIQPNGTVD